MTWSLFYPFEISASDGYDPALFAELEVSNPAQGLRTTYGLVNVSRPLQDLELKSLRALLLHKNPYTGLRYVDDPELAVLEIQNEDCVFFYNPLGGLRDAKKWPRHAQLLGQQLAPWVEAKYGT